ALSFIYGRVFVCATALDKASQSSLALELLCGYLVLNTILFFLIITSPLGLVADLAIVSIGGLAALFANRHRKWAPRESTVESPPLLAFVICGLAATLWCADSLSPPIRDGSSTIFPLWGDSFVHSLLIRAFF